METVRNLFHVKTFQHLALPSVTLLTLFFYFFIVIIYTYLCVIFLLFPAIDIKANEKLKEESFLL